MSTVSDAVGSPAVLAFQPRGSGVAVFLVSPGMEAVSLARYLGPECPLFGIRVPNLENLPEPHRIEDVARMCVREIRKVRSEGPYAVAGWCAAGFLGLEIARQLERQGAQVAFVAMFDARTVCLPSMSRGKRLLVCALHLAQRLRFFVLRVARHGCSPVRQAVTPRWTRARAAHLRARRGLGSDHEVALAAAIRNHHPAPWPGRMVHIWAAERPRGLFRDPQFICGFLSPHGFGFYEVPGNHISMLAEPCIAQVSRILAWEIDRASGIQGLGSGARSTISSRKIS